MGSRFRYYQKEREIMSDTIQEMTEKVKAFCEARDWDQYHDPKELSIGLSTEANELLSIFRFKSKEQMQAIFDDSQKRAHVEEEVADVFFFLLRFAQMNNLDLEECLDQKLERNEEKYPVDKVKGKNLKYTEI